MTRELERLLLKLILRLFAATEEKPLRCKCRECEAQRIP